jgi:hypothetical protein
LMESLLYSWRFSAVVAGAVDVPSATGVSKVPGVLAIHRVHIVAIAFGPDVVGVPAVLGSLLLLALWYWWCTYRS